MQIFAGAKLKNSLAANYCAKVHHEGVYNGIQRLAVFFCIIVNTRIKYENKIQN